MILKYINIFIFGICLLFSACSLEKNPLTDLAEKPFWSSNRSAELALTAVYRANITDGVEYNASDFWSYQGLLMIENLTDNAFDRRGENSPLSSISNGKLTPTNTVIGNYWKYAYKRVELCNRFLQGIERLQESELKKRYIGEVKFIRATQYFYLASYFKDVPLVTKLLSGEEANNVERTSQKQILEWCVQQFTEAAQDLPRFKDIKPNESGRVCKQAALAFLGRTYMLMNDWTNGAKIYKSIIDLGDNELHPSYPELFLPGKGTSTKENLFYIAYLENYFGCGLPQHNLSAKDGGWSFSNPTASLFEAYEFSDGTPFSYDDPRYDAKNLGKNRDPRLDYNLYYNGAVFMGSVYKIHPDGDTGKKERVGNGEVSKTGFMWRKYFDETPVKNLVSYSAVTPIIRYAEVLLSYVECLLESESQINQSTLDATINRVRARVGLPGIKFTDKAQLRQAIRHERRVELPFEGIRFWDIMRWKIADKVLVGEIWGAPYPDTNTVNIVNNQPMKDPTGHARWYVGKREFRSPDDYRWPIPEPEQNINPHLRK